MLRPPATVGRVSETGFERLRQSVVGDEQHLNAVRRRAPADHDLTPQIPLAVEDVAEEIERLAEGFVGRAGGGHIGHMVLARRYQIAGLAHNRHIEITALPTRPARQRERTRGPKSLGCRSPLMTLPKIAGKYDDTVNQAEFMRAWTAVGRSASPV
jgi:hypothetical protein